MNEELKTRSTDREALDRKEEERVEGRAELEMRFSQRTLEIAGTDPLQVPGLISLAGTGLFLLPQRSWQCGN